MRVILILMSLILLLGASSLLPAEGVTAFGPGERLEYVLKWAGIPAGDSVMEIVEGDVVDGAVLYRVISTAESRSLVDVVYKVRNRYETHIHPADGLTRKYDFNMREGGKRRKRTLIFDQNALTVTRIITNKDEVQSQVYEIPVGTQDNLSSLYALRNMDLVVGEPVNLRVFEGKKNWELEVDILAEEEVKVRAGTFRTWKIHPKLKYEGLFRRTGDLIIWVTRDQYRIPILMKSKVRVGSIDAELKSYVLADGVSVSPAQVLSEQE
ncbi:MAG: DUF3108 domain-containing protein [bacterium]|nr:DUF3108 domain-containing protein [bacterium]